MKKITQLGVVVVLLALGGWGIFAWLNSTAAPTISTTTQNSDVSNLPQLDTPEKTPQTDTRAAQGFGIAQMGGRYLPFTEGVLAQTASTRRVLFFYANWCPTCRPVDQDLQARTTELPADVTVIRVNYNDTETDTQEEALAQEYGITYQHTFVLLDEQGFAVTTWNGGGVAEILARVQ